MRETEGNACMSDIQVVPVETSRQRRQFLQLPWKLYADDPYWVPPLRGQQKELVGYRKHPFYERAEIQTFLAYRGSRVCGRIAAIDNFVHNETYRSDPRGFVGFFESENDQTIANRLFNAARGWLAARGLHKLRGPANPSLNYEWGLLIDGFERSPTFMMTYNPRYYQELWENYGFVRAQDLFSFIGHRKNLHRLESKVQFVADESIRRFNIQLRPVDKSQFRRDVRSFLEIYNKALVGTWGYLPLSENEMSRLSAGLRQLIVPQLTLVAEVDQKPIGVVFGLLDYNPRIKRINGRLFPFGFLQLLRKRHELRRVRLVSTNVLPEYQRWGVGVVLASKLLQPCLDFGVDEGEFSWVLESNHLSRKSLERGQLDVEKMHRIYDFFGDA